MADPFADPSVQTAGSAGPALSHGGSIVAPLDDGLFAEGAPPASNGGATAAESPLANGGSPKTSPIALDGFSPAAPASAESTEDAFFVHYTPVAHVEEPKPAAPERVDPRVAWRKQNAEVLQKKEAEETAAKQAVLAKAKEHLARFNEVRNTTLSQRKATNRKNETVLPGEVPTTGTTWEKVSALLNFSATAGHAKDVARYKSVLINCKAHNVAVKA